MFFKHFMQIIAFYKQTGFLVRTQDVTLPVDDLKTLKVGGITNYIFNFNFSYRAIGFKNKWQKESTSSFIPSTTYYYTKLKLEDPFLENQIDHFFNLTWGLDIITTR